MSQLAEVRRNLCATGKVPRSFECGNPPAAALPILEHYPAEVRGLGDNPRFVVTSLADPTPEALYRDLYCARGQDENFIQAVKNDLASDRTADHAFLANHLRLLYACAAYRLILSLRENTLCHTELAKAQPMSPILKLFKLEESIPLTEEDPAGLGGLIASSVWNSGPP